MAPTHERIKGLLLWYNPIVTCNIQSVCTAVAQEVTGVSVSVHIHTHTSANREEIRSGTVVTYNDRQEILCQKCTDLTLNDENGGEEDEPVTRQGKNLERQVHRSHGIMFSVRGCAYNRIAVCT